MGGADSDVLRSGSVEIDNALEECIELDTAGSEQGAAERPHHREDKQHVACAFLILGPVDVVRRNQCLGETAELSNERDGRLRHCLEEVAVFADACHRHSAVECRVFGFLAVLRRWL